MPFVVKFILWFTFMAFVIGYDIWFLSRHIKSNRSKKSKELQPFPVFIKIFALFAFLNTLLVIFGIGAFRNFFFGNPRVTNIENVSQEYLLEPTKPIVIQFDRPLDIRKIRLDVSGNAEGKWEYTGNFLNDDYATELKYTFTKTPLPNQTIEFYFAGLQTLLAEKEAGDYSLKIHTPKYTDPKVTLHSYDPQWQRAGSTYKVLDISLPAEEQEFAHFSVESEPKLSGELVYSDNEISFVSSQILGNNENYRIRVLRQYVIKDSLTAEISQAYPKEAIYTGQIVTAKVPGIVDYGPRGSEAAPDSEIYFKFSAAVDPQVGTEIIQNINILPHIQYQATWADPQTLKIDPQTDLAVATNYSVEIDSLGAVFMFATVGVVEVKVSVPDPYQSEVKTGLPIQLRFNQRIDREEFAKAFSITPHVNGVLIWDETSQNVVFRPDSLQYATTYTINVNKGLNSFWGTASSANYSLQFTTEPKRFELAVPLYQQELQYQCNVTAASMVLSYYGINITKEAVYAGITKQKTIYNPETNTWGDPHVGFVGDITGKTKGYGVYWEPVAKYLENYRKVKIMRRWNLPELLGEVEQGRPVIIWWQNGRSTPSDISWETPTGKDVKAVNGMHSEVVIGYIGDRSKPTAVILNDPWRGRRTITTAEFEQLWSYFDNTGIIVY